MQSNYVDIPELDLLIDLYDNVAGEEYDEETSAVWEMLNRTKAIIEGFGDRYPDPAKVVRMTSRFDILGLLKKEQAGMLKVSRYHALAELARQVSNKTHKEFRTAIGTAVWDLMRFFKYKALTEDSLWVAEFGDFLQVMVNGAQKYGAMNWLEENGKKADFESMHNSMFHHLADSYAGNREDRDSGLDPLLHLACRALMMYTLFKRGKDTYKIDEDF